MKDAFIVMGTDGLWEKLTNEQVVGLVGKYLDKAHGKESRVWFGGSRDSDLNVVESKEEDRGTRRPSAADKSAGKWVWQDKNAATHLIRNALGGGNLDQVRKTSLFFSRTFVYFVSGGGGTDLGRSCVGLCLFQHRWRDIIGTILLFQLFSWEMLKWRVSRAVGFSLMKLQQAESIQRLSRPSCRVYFHTNLLFFLVFIFLFFRSVSPSGHRGQPNPLKFDAPTASPL